MRVSPEWLETIDNWRRQQPDIPSRAEAIRRLVEAGLNTDLDFLTMSAVDAWVKENGAMTISRSEAIRRLIHKGIESDGRKPEGFRP